MSNCLAPRCTFALLALAILNNANAQTTPIKTAPIPRGEVCPEKNPVLLSNEEGTFIQSCKHNDDCRDCPPPFLKGSQSSEESSGSKSKRRNHKRTAVCFKDCRCCSSRKRAQRDCVCPCGATCIYNPYRRAPVPCENRQFFPHFDCVDGKLCHLICS